MTTAIKMTPFDIVRANSPLENIHGGDLAIGHSLQEWVSGEITVDEVAAAVQKVGRAYLPLVAISLNGWSALLRLQASPPMSGCLRDFEAASRYTCPYSNMEPWALVPLGILANDASLYREAFTAPGTWSYVYDMVIEQGRERHLEQQLGGLDVELVSVLGSLTLGMMGSGYTAECLSCDGDAQRNLVSVDLENGDKLVCVAWIWFNK
jgi:hypothetical protein